jgi:spore germination protein GerM
VAEKKQNKSSKNGNSAKKKSSSSKSKTRKSSVNKNKPVASKPSYNLFFILLVMVIIAAVSILYINHQLGKITKKPDKRVEQPISGGRDVDTAKPVGCIPVYYYDNEAQFFVPVHLPLTNESDPIDVRAGKIIKMIIAGPPTEDLTGVIPEGVTVNSVKVDKDMVIVDFSSQILDYGGGAAWEKGIVQSILLSLTELPGITKVQFLVNGEKIDYLPEGTEISQPLSREGGPNSSEYLPEGKSAGYMYYLDKSEKFLVPVYWTWDGSQDDPLAKLKALYQSPPPPLSNSLMSVAPNGLQIEKCEITNGTLVLIINHQDFTTAFSSRPPRMFIEATILTLYQMKPFTQLDIRVGNESDNLPIWSYSYFADLQNIPIPPYCYNTIEFKVNPIV